MSCTVIPMPEIFAGDAFPGLPLIKIVLSPEDSDPVPPENPLDRVTMRFQRVSPQSSDVVEITSDNPDQITIEDAENWEVSIPQQIIPGLTAGRWGYQIKFYDTAGLPVTYINQEVTIKASI